MVGAEAIANPLLIQITAAERRKTGNIFDSCFPDKFKIDYALRLDSRQIGKNYFSRITQILNRFPIQNRRNQARQQLSAGTARRGSKCQQAPPA